MQMRGMRLNFDTVISLMVNFLIAIGAFWYAQRQIDIAKEQIRIKNKNIIMYASSWSMKEFPPDQNRPFKTNVKNIRNPHVLHVHFQNSGEVPIDKGDFEVGPFLSFENSVIEARLITLKPKDFRAEIKPTHHKVEIKPLVEFKVKDFVSVDILFEGEPGPCKYTYRIKGGQSGEKPLSVENYSPEMLHPVEFTP